ncbi:MAG TPA: tRNA (adenosine(37)-N6)-dimethylallyltransferase MiaA [Rhodobacteraceae bacterium]|nr:tRNA (adenosine(37)-N6)-dimethylallyltransferase MiaA [Paracoccaceae bacterium]
MSQNGVRFNSQTTSGAVLIDINSIPADKPVLIAGATASGKSALALEIASKQGGVIVNADALQVFDGWRILTARPTDADLARADHRLYGHVGFDQGYSVGKWLRQVGKILQDRPDRPIIVGGTGLYFRALTEGLAEIPPTPPELRAQSEQRLTDQGLAALLDELDAVTLARIDCKNPVRVQRAWEVLQTTGRSLAAWQDATPPPVLPLDCCTALLINAERDWLNARINKRFDLMLKAGALEEARQMEPRWQPGYLSSKAIGATELIGHIRGEISLAQARTAACIASHQYAKRQRTWFRARMKGWKPLNPA